MKNLALFFSLIFCTPLIAQESNSPLVSFDDYENLMKEVKEHRKSRLVDLTTFNEMSSKKGVYILDTRSKEMYDRKHVKGAIHLNFSDFTQATLDALFPNRNATILIYCNNNFMMNPALTDLADLNLIQVAYDESFASKVSLPDYTELLDPTELETTKTEEQLKAERQKVVIEKPITLALNIPTYINLYGYGYRNVFELSELVSVYDDRIEFEGTDVIPVKN